MDIIAKDVDVRKDALEKFKVVDLMLTPLVNSTCVVTGKLSNVSFHERDLVDIVGSGDIVAIDSNYYHWKKPFVEGDIVDKPKKPKKKRKAKISTRPIQGDGTCFNSQMTFSVVCETIRSNPIIVVKGVEQRLRIDENVKNAIRLEPSDPRYVSGQDMEIVRKKYKVKVFRTGKFSIPGVLMVDLSDARNVLEKLCPYLSDLLDADVQVAEFRRLTGNYRTLLRDTGIHILNFQEYCNKHFTNLLNTNWYYVQEFLTNPAYMDRGDPSKFMIESNMFAHGDYKGIYHSYVRQKYESLVVGDDNRTRAVARISKLPDRLINMSEFFRFLQNTNQDDQEKSKKIKNLYINFGDLAKDVLHYKILDIHTSINEWKNRVETAYFIKISEQVLSRVKELTLMESMTALSEKYTNHARNNMISHISYDPQRFSGFIIRIKSHNKKKPTTIKLFSSGKINIDAVFDHEEAEYLYYWINYIFASNPNLIFNESDSESDSSDEYSYTDDEDVLDDDAEDN